MPYYYDSTRSVTSSGTPLTETATDLLILTAANQNTGVLTGLFGSARSPSGTSLAGAIVRVKTAATAGSGGSAFTPSKRRSDAPAAQTTMTTGGTTGTTLTTRFSAGMSAPGGSGGWMAMERDAGLHLKPNGGASGNAETSYLAGLASVVIEYTLEHCE